MDAAAVDVSDSQRWVTRSGACAHVFKAFIGSSVFMVPRYLQLSGYIVGPLLMWAVGAVAYDCVAMLVKAQTTIAKPDVVRDYAEVVGFVFGGGAKRVCGVSIVVLSICWIVIFFQISAGMVSEVLGVGEVAYPITVILGGMLSFVFSVFTNDLSRLAWVSGYSMVTALFLATVTLIAALMTVSSNGVASSVVAATDAMSTVTFLSVWSSVIFGITPILPIYLSMDPAKRQTDFQTVFRVMIVLIMLLHTVYGLAGYAAYGDTLTSVTLSKLPQAVWWATVLRLLLASTLLTSIPITLVPAALVLDASLGVPNGTVAWRDRRALVVRAVSVGLTTLVALVLGSDQVVLVAEYVGSTLCVILMFIVPVALDICTPAAAADPDGARWTAAQLQLARTPSAWPCGRLGVARRAAYVVVGFVVMIIGLVLAVRDTVAMVSR